MTAPGPRPKNLESWLRRMVKVHAEKIRCVLEDGSDRMVKVDTKGQQPRVASLQRAIEALEPAQLQALNADGDVLDVWNIVDPDELAERAVYAKDDTDTKEERMLKTFALLLAEAHRAANKQLVEVVGIQSASFAEERRHLSGALQASDRLLSKMNKTRVRVATDDAEEPDEGDSSFLQSLIGPMLQRMMRDEATKAAAAPAANGNAKGGDA
jgi:hypothetical protein